MDSPKASYKDFYYILGVSSEATTQEIREAYQELHEKLGPHVNLSGQDTAQMLKSYKDICEAYETLTNPQLRQQYDQTNHQHLNKGHLRQLWGQMKGGEGAPANRNDGEDTVIEMEVTLREALKGAERRVRIDEQLPCTNCVSLKPVQRLKCEGCRGLGYTHHARFEDLGLAPGLYDKQQLRFKAAGRFDQRTEKRTDLVLNIKVRPHQFFSVMGRDLTCTVPITIIEAILGGEIEIPTATGKVFMKIQPLTQTGKVYRLKGMGLAGADLLATMEVVVPAQINVDELELYRKLKTVSTTRNPREEILQKLSAQADQ